jgi:hypothetical protein
VILDIIFTEVQSYFKIITFGVKCKTYEYDTIETVFFKYVN